jgi:hypothetical protein
LLYELYDVAIGGFNYLLISGGFYLVIAGGEDADTGTAQGA